ncbi:MAG: F-box protein, partial [Chlamydiae bacterium]|nr:F-box protein [Chlamydiota bacterium]
MTRITQLSSLPTTTQTLEEAPDYLSRLAPELLAKIISYLPQTAQQQLALTCRSFYPLVRATSVASFNRFLKKNLNTLPTFANITHLHLPEDKPIAVPTWKLLKNKFPNIRALRCVPPTPGTLATTFPALTHLSTPSLASLPPSLDHLHLEDPTNFTASNPDLFKNTSTLRSFSLKISQLSSLAFLASLENVTSLSLEVTNSAQTPLITAPLNGLKKLTTLKVTGNLKEVIAHLQYMPQLETLVLEHPSAGTDFTPLLSLKNLKRLAILISPDLQDLAFIKEMPELKYLKISHCPQLKNVQALVCLDKIIYLDLSHNFEL